MTIVAALTAGALTLMAPWDLDPARVQLLELMGGGEAFRLAARAQAGQQWFSFAADWDTALTWPRGQTVVAVLKDGTRLEARMVMAMTPLPEGRPIMLGLESRRLDPSGLEHGRNGRVILLVSFPAPNLGRGDIRGIELARRLSGGVH